MITVQDMERLLFTGGDVVAPDGRKIGAVGQLFLDATTGDPAWVTVRTGLFGTSESFVPLVGAHVVGDDIVVPYGKDQVKHAPRIDSAEGHLPPDQERDLYRHYGLLDDEPEAHPTTEPAHGPAVTDDDRTATHDEDAGPGEPGEPDGGAGAPRSAEDSTVPSAEQVDVVGTERVPTERVRLRRYTVTDERAATVPVQREEVRVEHERGDEGQPPPEPTDDDSARRPGAGPGAPADGDPGAHRRTGRHVADPGPR